MVILLVLTDECESRGGRGGGGGGGGRGGGGGGVRGGGGGVRGLGSGGSGRSRGYGGSSTIRGRYVVGNYKTFGTPSRWSVRNGRSFYFIGFPLGYHMHHYSHGGYSGGSQRSDEQEVFETSSGMDATTLILLILFLIGVGLALYYAVICFQARPLSEKRPRQSDLGPLLNDDDDINGNHEGERVGNVRMERAIDQPDSVSPKPDIAPDPTGSKADNGLETPLKSVTFQTTPECAAKEPTKDGTVVLSIDEEPSPLDSSKSVLPPLREGHLSSQRNPERQPGQLRTAPPTPNEPQNLCPPVTPVQVSTLPLKSMPVSDEEDGLFVSEPSPQKDKESAPIQYPCKIENPVIGAPPYQEMYPPNPNQRVVHPPYPKQLPFVPYMTAPFFLDSRPSQTKPVLKPLYSDPGLPKGGDVYGFGLKHKSEENLEHTSKKQKMSNKSNKREREVEESSPLAPEHPNTPATDTPPLGWSIDVKCTPRVEQIEHPAESREKSDIHPETEERTLKPHVPSEKEKVRFQDASEQPQDSRDRPEPGKEIDELQNPSEASPSKEDCPEAKLTKLKDDVSQEQPIIIDPKFMDQPIKIKVLPEQVRDSWIDNPTENIFEVKIILPTEEEEVVVKEGDGVTPVSNDSSDDSESKSSSDPDVTEYSFQRDSQTPEPVAIVLADEISHYPDRKIGLMNYSSLPDHSNNSTKLPSRERGLTHIGHPPTPTSDTTKSVSPISSNDNSLDEINPNVLGTPPVTPPEGKQSPGFVIQNPTTETATTELGESSPSFIVIEPHKSRERMSSLSSSDSSSSSSSTSNGSYKIESTKEETAVTDSLENQLQPTRLTK